MRSKHLFTLGLNAAMVLRDEADGLARDGADVAAILTGLQLWLATMQLSLLASGMDAKHLAVRVWWRKNNFQLFHSASGIQMLVPILWDVEGAQGSPPGSCGHDLLTRGLFPESDVGGGTGAGNGVIALVFLAQQSALKKIRSLVLAPLDTHPRACTPQSAGDFRHFERRRGSNLKSG